VVESTDRVGVKIGECGEDALHSTAERGGRAKRYYALRPRAVEALKESRRALVALWRGLETALG